MNVKLIPFEPVKIGNSEYVITSGPQKGWRIHVSVHLKTVAFEGLDKDGLPMFTLGSDLITHPIPPVIGEESQL